MAENLNVSLELKDVSESEQVMSELITLTGKNQTPFLVDSEQGIFLHESSDIIDHLREYGKAGAIAVSIAKPRVHVGGSTCVSCEG